MRKLISLFVILVFISSCKKTEDVTIPNNVAPPDHTIDSSTILIYTNKAYINIVGREPLSNEKASALVILRQNNFSVDSRKQFLETLFSSPEYDKNIRNIANTEYLKNTDSLDVAQQLFVFNNLLTQPQYAPFYAQIQFEIHRLDTLQNALNDLNNGTLDFRGMLRRLVNNYFYDQINMGTENFVVSTFQNFLFRYPTNYELSEASNMVNGFNADVFLQLGKNKNDYIAVFFNSNDYYEGQVRYVYKKYLFREPTSAEISFYTNIYKSTNNYKGLQKEIFSLNEYAGVNW